MRNNPLNRSLGSCKMVSFVKIEGKTVKGVFKQRLTRFSALVKVGIKLCRVFLLNPRSVREILTQRVGVVLIEILTEKRKTAYDLIGITAFTSSRMCEK